MDKQLLEQYGLQDAFKRFQQINEYTFITSPIISEDGDENEQDNNVGMMNSDDNNQQNQQDMLQNGNLPVDSDNQQPNGEVPPINQNDDSNIDSSFNGENTNDETTEEQEGDTVIDVDDLTQAQETTEIKIDGVDDKLTRMLSLLGKFENALEVSDKKIDDLRNEFEKRNPSEQEKLNIRSQASYPYSETPKEYWDAKKASNPHYDVMYDNDVSTSDEQKKFDITRDDVKNINMNNVSRTLDLNNIKLNDFVNI